jgi:hypothetical protein
VFWDPSRASAEKWGTQKFPESYFVDAQGQQRWLFVGERDWNTQAAVAFFNNLLGQATTAVMSNAVDKPFVHDEAQRVHP